MENRIIELLKKRLEPTIRMRYKFYNHYNDNDMRQSYHAGIEKTINELIIVLKDYDNEMLKKLKG